MNQCKYPFLWKKEDIHKYNDYHGKKVFGTFISGGGSSFGYKLAGYDHLGGVEIDKNLSKVYQINHNPKYLYSIDIREFNKLNNLPDELYDLDILDGSPPCSSFSIQGKREKDWGKEKIFAEGQTKQRLDVLVFLYCDTINKLKPKVFILENVKGIIQGNAKLYVKKIINKLIDLYNIQIFLMNSSSMGVPQKRERVFFIGLNKKYNLPQLQLNFNFKPIYFNDIIELPIDDDAYNISPKYKHLFKLLDENNNIPKLLNVNKSWCYTKLNYNSICPTITTSSLFIHPSGERYLSKNELIQCSTFPIDYEFLNYNYNFIVGMSVPPVMMANISEQIYLQWLKKI